MSAVKKVESSQDYRDFIRVRLEALKAEGVYSSLNQFSKACGFSSKSFLQFVLSGKRNLTSVSAMKIAQGLKLTRSETHFFFSLVSYNQESEPSRQVEHLKRLTELRALASESQLSQERIEYVSKWYIPVIRELASLTGFKADPEWIAQSLFPKISTDQAKEALQVLTHLGFLKRLSNGALRPNEPDINITEEFGAPEILSFMMASAEISKASLMNLPSSQREFGHMTLSLDEERFGELKSELSEIRQRLFKKYGTSRVSDTAIYQFNLQLFPVSKKI